MTIDINHACSSPHPEHCSTVVRFDQMAQVVDELCDERTIHQFSMRDGGHQTLPSREEVERIASELRMVLFPGYFGIPRTSPAGIHFAVGAHLDGILQTLHIQVLRALCFTGNGCRDYSHCQQRAGDVTRTFLGRIPEIRRLLVTDVRAAYEGDPAATSYDEAIFCYPGLLAITCQRIAHELYLLKVPLIPRIITEYAHTLTGIDIHPGARIGEEFFIDHGTGVVIGETTIIGRGVRIYQGVTLGAKSFPLDDQGRPIKSIDRHPIVEDRVTIYSGATILGRITIGSSAVIGGNVWVTRDVPPGMKVMQQRMREERFDSGAGI